MKSKSINRSFPLLFILITFLSHCSDPSSTSSSLQEAWNSANDPAIFGIYNSKQFKSIPRRALLRDLPWSGSYWPLTQGGITYRWQTKVRPLQSPDYYQISNMGRAQLNRLSPAEKYDLWFGQFTYPLTSHIRQTRQLTELNGHLEDWNGICHGWAVASIRHKLTGKSVTVQNAYGHVFEFYKADIEALVSQYYADQTAMVNIGSRCNYEGNQFPSSGRVAVDECRDVNPGAFHLTLDHYINTLKKPFIADISWDSQVWNYPIVGYKTSHRKIIPFQGDGPLANHRAEGTAFTVSVTNKLTYVAGSSPSTGKSKSILKTLTLRYTLELDQNQNIIGGEWISRKRPDFLWIFQDHGATEGSYLTQTHINQLINGLNNSQ